MNVSAIIVTRGNVDLQPVLDSLPIEWEIVVWDNGAGSCRRERTPDWSPMNVLCGTTGGAPPEAVSHPAGWRCSAMTVSDLSVYGRYAAIEYASGELIYTQDDDVIVSDPQAIVDRFLQVSPWLKAKKWYDGIVANMPQEFRHEGYTDSCLVGFGACFHRDLPVRAFERFWERFDGATWDDIGGEDFYRRTCDVVFTTLTPRVLVDVPKTNREFAEDPDRMYKQPGHVDERAQMLRLAREVRDA